MQGVDIFEKQYEQKIDIVLTTADERYSKALRSYYHNTIRSKSYRTCYNYIMMILKFLKFTNKRIEDLSLDDFDDYAFLLKGYSATHQATVHTALASFTSYLYLKGDIKRDFLDGQKRPSLKDPEADLRRENNYLNKKELKHYVNLAKQNAAERAPGSLSAQWAKRDLFLILLLLTTGMRSSALIKLDIDELDITNQTINTVEKGNKLVPYAITDEVMPYCMDWLNARKKLLGDKEEHALFISNQRKRMSPKALYNITTKFGVDIDGKNISPHKLRATFATNVYKETKDIAFLQDSMHHASVSTSRIYIRGQKAGAEKKSSNIMGKVMSNLI